MKLSFLFCGIALFILLFFSACSPIYQLARSEMGPSFLEKPQRAPGEETTSGVFLTGSYASKLNDNSSADQNFERNYAFEGAIHKAWCTDKKFYAAIGASGYGGQYEVNRVSSFKGNKRYYGVGVMGELGLSIDREGFSFRPMGLQLSIFKEFGEYASFRQDASHTNEIFNMHPNDLVVMFGLNNELTFQIESMNLGVQLAGGYISSEFYELNRLFIYNAYIQSGLRASWKSMAVHAQFGWAGTNLSTFFSTGVSVNLSKY